MQATRPLETAAVAAARESSPLLHVPSHARLWGVALAGLALDLWTKRWAFAVLGQGGRRSVIPGVLELQTMLNDGALFGIGSGQTTFFILASVLALVLVFWMFLQTPPSRGFLQVALGAILAGAVGNLVDRVTVRLVRGQDEHGRTVYYEQVSDEGGAITLREFPAERAGSAAHVLTGTAREKARDPAGYVRDFIKLDTTLPNWEWIPARIRGRELWPWVFNVADMLLVGGVAVLAVHLWLDRRVHRRERATPAGAGGPEGPQAEGPS